MPATSRMCSQDRNLLSPIPSLEIHEFPAHEQTQHRPSKGLGECCDIVQRQRHERAVRPEPAIGHQQMEVRVPVCQGAVGLDRCDDADREARLTYGR